jgi:hypothetical protein
MSGSPSGSVPVELAVCPVLPLLAPPLLPMSGAEIFAALRLMGDIAVSGVDQLMLIS